MNDLERAPILRVMPGPSDINANGHIFGGWVLSQMDIAAGIVASRRARGPVATVVAGSVSRHLAHHAPCPVLVVPRGVTGLTGIGRDTVSAA